MKKPLPPSQDAINARARRRRNFAIPTIYQQHYEELTDGWRDVISVDFERSNIDFNMMD